MTNAAETVVNTPAPAPKVRTLAEVQARVLELIAAQNEITVVSSEIVEIKGKGKRVELILSGAGVGDPTRRYFLRENSAFASGVAKTEGLIMHAPKKARGAATYQLNFGLNEAATTYEAPAPEKPAKVKLSAEEAKARRIAGKQAAKAAREAAAAEAAANAPAEPEADTTELTAGEPVVISQDEPELAAA